MSIEQTCHDIIDQTEHEARLNELGTFLRDEKVRSMECVRKAIPAVLGSIGIYPIEVLRVLVNYTANNDANRLYMLSDQKEVCLFWEYSTRMSVKGAISEMANKLMVLITQFVRAEDTKRDIFLKDLNRKGIIDWVWRYYETCTRVELDCIDDAIEVLAAFAKKFPESTSQEHVQNVIIGLEAALNLAHDESTEDILLSHTLFLIHVTSVDDSTLTVPTDRLLSCIEKISSELSNCTELRRNLFTSCGSVFSFPSYNNFSNIDSSVSFILNAENPYAVTAACISLGNCVADKESQARVISKIENTVPLVEVAQLILHCPFADVIQLQAFHFFNNCMNEELARDVLQEKNVSAVFRNTKIMVDNYNYYKNIGAIYFKFLSKLVTLAYLLNSDCDITLFDSTWGYLNNLEDYCEAQMLLLQAICIRKGMAVEISSKTKPLIERLLLIKGDTLDATELLTRIKTLAIIFQTFDKYALEAIFSETELKENFMKDLLRFFSSVLLILCDAVVPSRAEHAARAAIANNAKFVAAAAMKFFDTIESSYTDEVAEAREVCARVLREPQTPFV
ncbi:hypothetical protein METBISCDRAFT_21153 [Metschnikowia bicuspidata]|uniref:ARM repeat-containing protein n=1 Tax=Metschnikowia bicuspidata TaxID=27322 RepID=A0A4P9ZL31_9ASCO|nr:hypothetical protein METBISCDRAFT_21153 [Metschnikowia bicuspidata]